MTAAKNISPGATSDSHSYARPADAVMRHLDLHISVDFDSRKISGTATYTIENLSGASHIIFDTRRLHIAKVYLDEAAETAFELGPENSILGQPLKIEIKPDTKRIKIDYSTTPEAAALQWLTPQQTAGKQHPFLFTQSQAILARTWIPIQDSPGIRITYKAQVEVPAHLIALMSASNPKTKTSSGIYTFEMKHPIPSYLMALAVGDLEFRALGTQTGIYAEPATLGAAAHEFAEMESMLHAAEKLYGEYRWGRYDLLVLPPSFPFGGMENPCLTFVTPTVLAKDRSLTSLIAHELAHSWSGNLVTNATWNDFWLNEGFTVYFERRIIEALYGKAYAEMLEVLGYQELQETIKELGATSNDTCLKLDLDGRDPDDGLNDIAYEKGNFFLKNIEHAVGRERFDAFVKKYFNAFAFRSTNTALFLDFLQQELIKGDKELEEKIRVNEWVFTPGVPQNFKAPTSGRFEAVEAASEAWINGTAASELSTGHWSSHEWLHFIRLLPNSLRVEQMVELDEAFQFTASGNAEVLAAWLLLTIRNNYQTANQALEEFLTNVGRRKFLVPIYKALLASETGKVKALQIYAKARPNYHAVSTVTLDELIHHNEAQL